jgi:hypothetical protein
MGSVVRHLLERRYRQDGTRATRHPRLESLGRRRGYYGPPRTAFLPHSSTLSPSDLAQTPSFSLPDGSWSESGAFPLLPSTATEQCHCAREQDSGADVFGRPPRILFVPSEPLQAPSGVVTVLASVVNAICLGPDIGGRTGVQATTANYKSIHPSPTPEPDKQTSAARRRTTTTISRRPDLQVARVTTALVQVV